LNCPMNPILTNCVLQKHFDVIDSGEIQLRKQIPVSQRLVPLNKSANTLVRTEKIGETSKPLNLSNVTKTISLDTRSPG
jgi:hypothetical protein